MTLAAVAVTLTQLAPTSATWVDPTTFATPMSAGNWYEEPPLPPASKISDGGISAGNDATEVANIAWYDVGPNSLCTVVSVRGTSATAQPWKLTIDLTQVPFRGADVWRINLPDGGIGAAGPNNTYVITGKAGGWVGFDPYNNNTPITNAQTAMAKICIGYGPTPQGDPSWYTASAAPSTVPGDWTDTRACIVMTVTTTQTSLAANPFFYGWTTILDLSPAIARLAAAGKRADQVQWAPYPDGSALSSAPGPGTMSPTYQLTSGATTALRAQGSGQETRTITACVVHYG